MCIAVSIEKNYNINGKCFQTLKNKSKHNTTLSRVWGVPRKQDNASLIFKEPVKIKLHLVYPSYWKVLFRNFPRDRKSFFSISIFSSAVFNFFKSDHLKYGKFSKLRRLSGLKTGDCPKKRLTPILLEKVFTFSEKEDTNICIDPPASFHWENLQEPRSAFSQSLLSPNDLC